MVWNCRRWNLGAATLLVLLINLSVCLAQCPANFLQLHNRCYYFSGDRLQWIDAHFRCKDLKSNLIQLPNKNQDHRLRHYLWGEHLDENNEIPINPIRHGKNKSVPNEWWIGANFDWKQKVWKWAASGKPLKYQRFAQKQRNVDNLQWNCAILDPNVHYKWNTRKCTDLKHYICQKKAENFTEILDNNIPIISPNIYLYYQELALKTKRNESIQPGYIKKRPIRTKSKYDSTKSKFLCPKGYRHIRGMCYHFSREPATWQDAYYTCDGEYNGTLAIIHDRKTDKALRRSYKRSGLPEEDRWIGGRYDWEGMAWKWAQNGIIIQHQAYDREMLRWHCLVWSPLIGDKWTSDNCVKEKHYICQTKGKAFRFPQQQQQQQQQMAPAQIY